MHLVEPRFAQLVYEQLLNAGDDTGAETLAADVVARRTTDGANIEWEEHRGGPGAPAACRHRWSVCPIVTSTCSGISS